MIHKREVFSGTVVLLVVLIFTSVWLTRSRSVLYIQPDDIVVQAYLQNVDPNSKLPDTDIPTETFYKQVIQMKIDNEKKTPLANDNYTIRVYPIFAYSPLRSGVHVSGNPDDFSIGSSSASLALVKKEVEKTGFAGQWDLIKKAMGFAYLKASYPITPMYFTPKDAPLASPDNTFIVMTYMQDSGGLSWSKRIPLTVQK
ncbi:hypothetical protein [Paenibacillus sp. SN-8-1]|uniref:hypothetical protein n=1 Tax=Paenibacillus sp. SN-8-1 TaxID=3435409 RepID=UPI003D9A1855